MTNEERRHQIKFFINKFEATREDEWCIGQRWNVDGQRCALGMTHPETDWSDTKETQNLGSIFAAGTGYMEIQYGMSQVAVINNGNHPFYKQPTPRQRILAALHDILKKCL